MSTTWASKISWILSPTRSYIACMSSFCGEALLDAVDDRQLGRALVGLGQEPLGLVEQARVLERDAHARGERRDEALVGLGVGVALGESDATTPMASSPAMIGTPSQDSRVAPPPKGRRLPSGILLVRASRSAAAVRVCRTRDVSPSPSAIGVGVTAVRLRRCSYGNVITVRWPVVGARCSMSWRSRICCEPLADQLDDRLEVELLARGPRRSR